MTSPVPDIQWDRSCHRPLPGAQGDPSLSQASWRSFSQADPISRVLSVSTVKSAQKYPHVRILVTACLRQLLRSPSSERRSVGVQEQHGVGAPPHRQGRKRGGKGDTAPPAGDGVRGGGAWPGTGTGEGVCARGPPHPPFSHLPRSAELRRSPLARESAAESRPTPRAVFLSGIITEEMIILSVVLCLSLNL